MANQERLNPGRFEGRWWLPATPETTATGVLVVQDSGEAELQLIGTLGSEFDGATTITQADGSTETTVTQSTLQNSGTFPRILGQVGGSLFTLDDCFQTRLRGALFGAMKTQRIHVHRVIRGAYFDAGEDLEFARISVQLSESRMWVARTGIEESLSFREDENGEGEILGHELKVKNIEDLSSPTTGGAHLAIRHFYTVKPIENPVRGFAEHFEFVLDTTSLAPLDDLLQSAGAMRDLVTIATGRTSAFERVTLRHPDAQQKVSQDTTLPITMDLVSNWVVQPDSEAKPLRWHDLIFTLEDLGGIDVAANWVGIAEENRSTLSRVMSTRYSETMYVTDSLLNCAVALEAYDRDKHGDDIHYVERLKRCAAYAGDFATALIGDVPEWVKQVKRARNDVAHHNANIASGTSRQYFLARSAYWVFVVCLLRDAGAPETLFNKIQEHRDFKWIRDSLQALDADGAADS